MIEVEISEVERELARLWKQAAPKQDDTEGGNPELSLRAPPAPSGVLRACALNLIVAGCEEQHELPEIMQEVTLRHPCRAISLSVEKEAGSPRASISMLCHPGGRGQPQVCSEQLVLAGPASALHEMVAAVAGLLAPDLPVFLWWRGRPPQSAEQNERFDHLADVSDHVLFDSADFDGTQLARMAELARANPEHTLRAAHRRQVFGDLNWTRLTLWRAAVAQCFDSAGCQALLPLVERAKITFADAERSPRVAGAPSAAARLLGGWLRSRLTPPPAVEFAAGVADLLELHASSACFRVPRPAPPSTAAALADELNLLARDRVFEQALLSAVA